MPSDRTSADGVTHSETTSFPDRIFGAFHKRYERFLRRLLGRYYAPRAKQGTALLIGFAGLGVYTQSVEILAAGLVLAAYMAHDLVQSDRRWRDES